MHSHRSFILLINFRNLLKDKICAYLIQMNKKILGHLQSRLGSKLSNVTKIVNMQNCQSSNGVEMLYMNLAEENANMTSE